MPSFSQLRDMYRAQREAKKVKKDLAKIHIEAEGRFCAVVVSAEQEILSITIRDASSSGLGDDIKDAVNRAMKKAQVVASEKMKPVMESMGMQTS